MLAILVAMPVLSIRRVTLKNTCHHNAWIDQWSHPKDFNIGNTLVSERCAIMGLRQAVRIIWVIINILFILYPNVW